MSVCPKKSGSLSWGREVTMPGFYLRGFLVFMKRYAISKAYSKFLYIHVQRNGTYVLYQRCLHNLTNLGFSRWRGAVERSKKNRRGAGSADDQINENKKRNSHVGELRGEPNLFQEEGGHLRAWKSWYFH